MSQPRSTVPRIGNYKSQKLLKLRRARNAPSTIVDAAPAQDHVCWLVSLGFNDSSIAAACELTQKTIANFRNRVYSNARAVQSARILAVSHVPCAAQHTRYVPSLGAQRRIRALLAIGWRYADIGAETGMLAEGVARIMRVTTILGRTWSAISHAYNKLSGTRGPSTQGAKKAVKRGFPPPLAWEGIDIDHPDSAPVLDAGSSYAVDEVLLQRMIDGRHSGEVRGVERRALIDHAIAKGWDHDRLARSLNVSPDGAGQALVRRRRELRREVAA